MRKAESQRKGQGKEVGSGNAEGGKPAQRAWGMAQSVLEEAIFPICAFLIPITLYRCRAPLFLALCAPCLAP